jgi:hypothetical protein
MTKRAEKVYLAFFESEDSNGECIANALKVAAEVILPTESQPAYFGWKTEMLKLAEELRDPQLVEDIYGHPDEEF